MSPNSTVGPSGSRVQRVSFEDADSHLGGFLYGSPQGSALLPMHFNTSPNDIIQT